MTPQSRAEARRVWGLPEDAFVVLVVGGSQGARPLNDVVAAWTAQGLPDGVALIWATGKQQAAGYLDRESGMVRVRPYLAPIADAYAAADLAVTRAGAMTIAELCAWGIPALLVPLPSAAQDHQTHNAQATQDSGAARYVPQRDLTVASLEAAVRALRDDRPALTAMHEAALTRARPAAAAEIATSVIMTLGLDAVGIG
jgi:UDP-N-acetylglucosamine--N-acetylmuramyl-(pentapeptide) pyrophosphoryl-undecaprenol N-acetylglucosamine transferase